MANYAYKTTVDAAPLSRALVDASTVFDELGITSPSGTESARMESVILQVSALIDRFLDRELAEADVTDSFRGTTGDTLRLSRWPVAEIMQVIESGTEITIGGWELNDVTGELWRVNSAGRYDWSCSGTTTVSYVGGYILPNDLPADIARGVIDQVKLTYLGGDRDPALRSLDIPGVSSETYNVAGGSSIGEYGLLASLVGALWPYRRVVV